MKKLKKGDIVGRISYGKDIIFVIERVIKNIAGSDIAILKGLTIRIQADSPLEDLELMDAKQVENQVRSLEERVAKRIEKQLKLLKQNYPFREKIVIYTGRILHIDGDRKYSEKSRRYYKKMGLNAIVKNISERKQPFLVATMLQRYNPDILVLTGHDGMIKKGTRI